MRLIFAVGRRVNDETPEFQDMFRWTCMRQVGATLLIIY
jgi:hypothetical protein